jgi:uncharacterized protein (DUF983 family)
MARLILIVTMFSYRPLSAICSAGVYWDCIHAGQESMSASKPPHKSQPTIPRRAVGPGKILARGLTLRCPNCGAGGLFRGLIGMRERCPRCGLLFEREQGFFLGAMVFNYTFTALIAGVVPCVILLAGLAYAPLRDQVRLFVAAVVAGLVLPLLFYRPSKSLWLMTYYLFVPHDLPANGGEQERNEIERD